MFIKDYDTLWTFAYGNQLANMHTKFKKNRNIHDWFEICVHNNTGGATFDKVLNAS